ncbi:CBL-interacting serine/threonine-protein kinase 11 [Diplonema papillatum]|nr:CBL-interacting serine/threonine-protein kinase 11 [Diplonema papillatum]
MKGKPKIPLQVSGGTGDSTVKPVTDGAETDFERLNTGLRHNADATRKISSYVCLDKYGRTVPPADKSAVLGRGSYGSVFRMREKETGSLVAVKVLRKDKFFMTEELKNQTPPENLDNLRKKIAKSRSRLLIEIAVLKQLSAERHENLLLFRTMMHDTDNIYIVMDIAVGYTLYDHLAKCWRNTTPILPIKDTVLIAAQLLHTLEYLHAQGVIHRDIKLENIMVDPMNLSIKLIDFGHAKCTSQVRVPGVSPSPMMKPPQVGGPVSSSPSISFTPHFGTALYLPKEALSGMVSQEEWFASKPQATKLDVYAAGMIIFILLCGPPQEMSKVMQDKELEDKHQQLMQTLESDYLNRELDTKGPQCCPVLLHLVKKMLALNPEARPTTTECIEELNKIYPYVDNKAILATSSIALAAAVVNCVLSDGRAPLLPAQIYCPPNPPLQPISHQYGYADTQMGSTFPVISATWIASMRKQDERGG